MTSTRRGPQLLGLTRIATRFRKGFEAAIFVFVATLTSVGVAFVVDEPPITIDGRFEDWSDFKYASDPAGDASAAFDLTYASAVTQGTTLYLVFDYGAEVNLQNGARREGTLTLTVAFDDEKLEIDFRDRFAALASAPNQRISWRDLDMVSQPTYAASKVEMRMDLAAVGAEVGDHVTIQFGGSDQLAGPINVWLRGEAPAVVGSTARKEGTDVRVVSLNTLNQGTAEEERAESIRRLLASTEGDVFCFQEERRQNLFQQNVDEVVPHAAEVELNTAWSDGCAIATAWPLRQLEFGLDRGVAGAVTLPSGEAMVVVSVHLKCCGYKGSSEDELRIEQAKQLKEAVAKMRAGEYGDDLTEAPIVILGDYNLVGSRTPLTIIESAELQPWLLLGLNDAAATTWRGNENSSFWPGRLDALTYDATRMNKKNGFLMDTSRLTREQLLKLNLEPTDSEVSDHLMTVADFDVR